MNEDEPIFAPCYYSIKSQGNNNFILTSEESNLNKIKIAENKAIYDNSNVKIDGKKYCLKITAKAVK